MKKTVAWFAENHVAANLLMLFLLLAGALTGLTMKLEVFPEASLDRINVSVVYSGASPAEVEEGIVRKIEESVSGLAGIKKIDATAMESYGNVSIEVMKGWDLDSLLDDVKAEVARINTCPEDAEEPVVREVIGKDGVIFLVVYGDVTEGKTNLGGVAGAGLKFKLPGILSIRGDADVYVYKVQLGGEVEGIPLETNSQWQVDLIVSAGLVISLI